MRPLEIKTMIMEKQSSAPRWLSRDLVLLQVILFAITVGSAGCLKGMKRGPIPGLSETLLFRASAKGDVSEARRLLEQGTNVNAREEEGETPLMYAAVEDRTEVAKLLLDRGADIDAVSLNDETALIRAVGMSRYETVTFLLNRGADIEKGAGGKGTPLIRAAGNGDVRMIKLLLDRRAKINAVDNEGYTALVAAVSRRASPDAVELLISSGAKVDVKNKRGETPLMVAERNGDDALVSLLTKAR
jgi:ankyrin repeat protein